ncbi:translocation/assembly module TamB domain-containing protein [Marivita sp. GX14005]|uniref:translocation/assembly module TamB domain-containing protein n=1 Tax=Marivita sp. GX14005 TaxID=2942276 RepID=UPI002019E9D4|nr:translocation/assembly module TamB domain-containing protein [Marivita sp. GX14005]MCL3881411.1 translocation/assembly module TamB domain-containing protein [Marivita sp. GX14005]
MRFILIFLALFWLPVAAVAQEDDDGPGYLAGLLQDALSGAGRDVRIRGFEGALSSEATIALLAISDEEGEWFRAEDIVLDWNRSALLRGRVEVTAFTAQSVTISRAPQAGPDLPEPEATPFTIPDLPVSVEIGRIGVNSLVLGEPLLGERAEFSVEGSASLADGGADIAFVLNREDGKDATIELAASYDPDTRQLSVDLDAQEAAGGIAAEMLGIPGEPSVSLTVQGAGEVEDFEAEIALATDGAPRITGTVAIMSPAERDGWDLRVDISGDPTPLVTDDVRDFFGTDIALKAQVSRDASGQTELPQFELSARALTLEGSAVIGADGWPVSLDATGRLANPEGGPVTLPFGGGDTQVASVTFDAQIDDDLRFDAKLDDLRSPSATLGAVTISGRGALDRDTLSDGGAFELDLTWDASDLALADPALADAVGTDLSGSARIDYQSGSPVQITNLRADGEDFGLSGSASWNSAETIPLGLDLRLVAERLDRFSALAGRDLGGRAEVSIEGDVAPISGMADLVVDGTTVDLSIGQDLVDGLLSGVGTARLNMRRDETGTTLREARIATPAARIDAKGDITSESTSLQFDGEIKDLSRAFPGEAAGSATLDGSVELSGTVLNSAEVTADISNASGDVRLPVAGGLTLDGAQLRLSARGGADGSWQATVRAADLQSEQVSAASLAVEGNGQLRQSEDSPLEAVSGTLTASASGLRLADPRISQAIGRDPKAQMRFDWQQGAQRLSLDSFSLEAGAVSANGTATVTEPFTAPAVEFSVNAEAGSLAPLSALTGQSLRGSATISASGTYASGGGFDITADGQANSLGIGNPIVDRLFAGTTRFDLAATGANGALESLNASVANNEINAQVSGTLDDLDIDARLRNVGLIAPDFQGALRVDGSVQRRGGAYRVDVDVDGPGGTTLGIAGQVTNAQSANLRINGTAPLGLANAFIEPRRLNGQARIDLTLSGPLGLGSLSGTITPVNAQASAPTLGIILNPISGQIRLQNGAAQVNLTAQGNNGGSVAVDGRLGLDTLTANLTATLDRFGVRDVELYDTSVDGNVNITGTIGQNLLISGDLRLNETEIQVPSTGITALSDIPPIDHIGATRPVMRTIERADLDSADRTGANGESSQSSTRLDLTLRAPGQVFVRGRGLDAELAGELRLTGTTANIIPQGGFELVRGRLDILNQRFTLDEGRVQMSGSFNPILRFVASTRTDGGVQVRIILDGPASSPDITFSSTPELPEDEVLAQLLFGRDLSNLSALQALELANAVATLAGRSSGGILSNLREGFGLDDLDVSQSEDGGTAVRAGKYISDNVYSDVVVESGGRTEINLNLDVTDEITARGSVDNEGGSSIGIFFERDY